MKTSKIWLIDKSELQSIIDESSSIVEVLIKLGFNPYNGNHRTVLSRITKDGLDTTQFEINRKKATKTRMDKIRTTLLDNNQMFAKNTKHTSSTLRNRIIKTKLLEYKCSECNLSDNWNNKPLSLQLDHIDGDSTNNELSNLRFLCPNCHSQTCTYGSKNRKYDNNKVILDDEGNKQYKKICKECKNEIITTKYKKLCNKCFNIQKNKLSQSNKQFNPTKEELQLKINEFNGNVRAIARFYNVCESTIRRKTSKLKIFD